MLGLPLGQLFLNSTRGFRPAEVADYLFTPAAKSQLADESPTALLDLHRALSPQDGKVFGCQP